MIFTLIIKCVEGAYLQEPFERTIEVSDDMTLGELHDTIQDLTGFDNDHLFTFFISRGARGKRTPLVEIDEPEERQGHLYEIPLRNVFPLPPKMALFYWFDFGDDWIFRIGKRRTCKLEDSDAGYPKIIAEKGPQPVQYPEFE